MTTHAMIDLETLATTPNATVLTIGGVKFDPNSVSEVHSELYFKFDVNEQTANGRDVDDKTVEWWSTQSKEVQEDALGEADRTPVIDVLKALNKWCVGVDAIWAQGPAFDIVILEDMYRQHKHHLPWPFWKVRDSRTLFQIMPVDPRKAIDFKAHNALEDCKIQALCVQQSIRDLKLKVR